jgi:hypothetical protein
MVKFFCPRVNAFLAQINELHKKPAPQSRLAIAADMRRLQRFTRQYPQLTNTSTN